MTFELNYGSQIQVTTLHTHALHARLLLTAHTHHPPRVRVAVCRENTSRESARVQRESASQQESVQREAARVQREAARVHSPSSQVRRVKVAARATRNCARAPAVNMPLFLE